MGYQAGDTRRVCRAGARGRIPDFPSLGSNRTGLQPYGSRVLRTWGVAPGWYCVGALPLLLRLALPPLHAARFEKKIHPASTRCGATIREAPKARLHTSLGQRPRSPAQNRPGGLKARLIPPSVAGKSGMRPSEAHRPAHGYAWVCGASRCAWRTPTRLNNYESYFSKRMIDARLVNIPKFEKP